MQYEIKGGQFPVVICTLADGESMITEGGSMVWMTPNFRMETTGGGVGKMFSKAFSGESLFQNIYTPQGPGMIAFGSSFPGRIMPIQVSPGHDFVLQKVRSKQKFCWIHTDYSQIDVDTERELPVWAG